MNTNTLNTINMDEQDIIDMNIYFPTVHKLLFIEKVTELEWLFRVEYKNGKVNAGQFMQVSLPGVGESPISVANFDLEEGYLDFLIRKVGKVTDKIFELKAGDFIPATLQTGINSDLPSKVIVAVVSENVRDTISGKHILIPQGTRVIGTYDSSVTFGQERLLVVWQRLIFPDGKSIGLDNMQGVDLSGKAGITGEIDNHFGTLLKGVVLSSIMGSAGAIVTDRKNDCCCHCKKNR